MKPAEQALSDARRQQTESILARHVHALFQRLPMLSGFWLASNLELSEVSIFSWPGYVAGPELCDEVQQALVDLAEERPDAVQLMRGRTFARAVH